MNNEYSTAPHKLVIAEKPSVAKTYADVLGAKSKREGYYEGNGYIVSWCIGHLLGLAEPSIYDEKYKKWRKEDLPISPENWKYIANPSTKKQLKVLTELIKRQDISTIINGADAGREGELIFRLVYENAKSKKPIQRLWISSMEEVAIKDGFNNLRPGSDYDSLYQAAKCRQQADWLVGMNFSRLFSVLYNTGLRVGRVQTPTLAMVVDRFEKVSNFIKEPFYVVELLYQNSIGRQQSIMASKTVASPDHKQSEPGFIAEGERLADKAKAEEIANKCNGQTATIKSIKKQDKSIAPPKLYDLTTLQREANKIFGLTASKTLEIAQGLYEKKIITYPRTDSKFITEDMAGNIPDLVKHSIGFLPFETNTPTPSSAINVNAITNNKKVTDHHAILPTVQIRNIKPNDLNTDEFNILLLICVKLACAVSEKHTYAETTVVVECAGEIFTTKGKTTKNNGWKQIEEDFNKNLGRSKGKKGEKDKKNKEDENHNSLPADLKEGQQSTAKTSVREGFTSPPKLYTEDTLLSAMENAGAEGVEEEIERKGLGTPATRAGIIENLIKGEFLKRDKKNLLPTEKGINLIKVLPDKVKSPLLTADWENILKRMERGEVVDDDFMKSINDFVVEVISTHGNTLSGVANPFGSNNKGSHAVSGSGSGSGIESGRAFGDIIGSCPRCGKNMVESPKSFSCENTRNKSCGFALWKENKWFVSQGKKITKDIAESLLKDGKVFIKGLKSQKTGKTYDATVILDDNKEGYTNFKLDFGR